MEETTIQYIAAFILGLTERRYKNGAYMTKTEQYNIAQDALRIYGKALAKNVRHEAVECVNSAFSEDTASPMEIHSANQSIMNIRFDDVCEFKIDIEDLFPFNIEPTSTGI